MARDETKAEYEVEKGRLIYHANKKYKAGEKVILPRWAADYHGNAVKPVAAKGK